MAEKLSQYGNCASKSLFYRTSDVLRTPLSMS